MYDLKVVPFKSKTSSTRRVHFATILAGAASDTEMVSRSEQVDRKNIQASGSVNVHANSEQQKTTQKTGRKTGQKTERASGRETGRPAGSAHPNAVLAICCMSLLLVGMDVTIVNVALPAIEHDLHARISELQWIVDAYTLVVASLLMFSGALSDRFGRRLVFQTGITIFTIGSLLCSLAPSIGGLIGFRALQGLGASMLNPVALSIIANVFTEPKARAKAIGIWGAVAGLSFGVGPLLGGILTQTVGWRAIFWVNVPLGLTAFLLAARFIPESKAARARAFDPVGQALVFVGLAALTSGVIEGPHLGWQSPWIWALFAMAGIALISFLAYEPRRKQPLVDLRFFRSVPFTGATVTAMAAFACFAAFLFLNALYLQHQRGLSPFRTGLYTLPLAVVLTISAPLSGRLVGGRGPRPSLMLAGAGFLTSTLMLTRLTDTTPVWWLLVSYVLFGVGLGMVNPAITNSAVSGMPLEQAGVAAAIASTSRQVGAALGVAIAGTVVGESRTRGIDFTRATHPVWWVTVAAGAMIMWLGWAVSTPWARRSVDAVKELVRQG
jgi:EmrB/QacA subfamily drug resistance transporter